MATYATSTQLVPGDIAGLQRAAAAYASTVQGLTDTRARTTSLVGGSTAYWSGAAGDGFRATGTAQATRMQVLEPMADAAQVAYSTLARQLEHLRSAADDVFRRSEQIGLPPGALTSNPVAVALFVAQNLDRTADVARLLGEVVWIRLQLNSAHQAFIAAVGGVTETLREGDRRTPDERDGRRIRNDDLTRRGEPGSGHLSNDWAGRAILERYLRGGGDWVINEDPDWSDYMMANDALRRDMADRTGTIASDALDRYLYQGQQRGTFDDTFSQAIENGEGIVGYQYLHGTNADVGGFQHSGNTTVTPLSDGTYRVNVDASYTWNDVIDPNPQYSTDRWKSTLAEIVTLGQADPYDIHITWTSPTEVIVDQHGNVLSMTGYPE